MNKLEDIKNCHVCGSNNLTPLINIPVPEILTDEITMRSVLFCEECESLHYIEDGNISYEFSCTLGKDIGHKVNKTV